MCLLHFSFRPLPTDATLPLAAPGHARGRTSRWLLLPVYVGVLLGQVGPQLKRGHKPSPAALARVGELLCVHLDHVFPHVARVTGPVLAQVAGERLVTGVRASVPDQVASLDETHAALRTLV